MTIYLAFFLFLVGLALIVKGGDVFIDSAVVIADRLGVSHIIIGATIVSLGTTLPEVATSLQAAFKGHSQFALGNAIGSIDFNTGIVLGVLIVLSTIKINREDFQIRGGFLIGLAFLLYLLSALGQGISRFDGVILLAVLLGYVFVCIREYRSGKVDVEEMIAAELEEEDGEKGEKPANAAVSIVEEPPLWREGLKLALGAAMVVMGANLLVDNGVKIADFLGVPNYIISLTMVAFGTSLPELTTSIIAMVKKHHNLSVGNILGANIMNIGLAVALSAIANPIAVTGSILSFDLVITIIFITSSVLFGLYYRGFRKYNGALLLGIYAFYIFCIYIGTDRILAAF